MLNNKKTFSLAVISIVICVIVLVLTQNQTFRETIFAQKPDAQIKNVLADFEGEFPVIDYDSDHSIKSTSNSKSKKYDTSLVSLEDNVTGDTQVRLNLHWATGLTSLPVEKSDAVIIGVVENARAHLSSNKKSVYSEFDIKAEQILKDDGREGVMPGKVLTIEREGGIVRFPSGYKTMYFVAGQRMPRVGQRYVFFLTHDFPLLENEGQDFYLLTAYQIADNKVIALDNPGAGTHPIATAFRGKNASFLLDELRKAIREKIQH